MRHTHQQLALPALGGDAQQLLLDVSIRGSQVEYAVSAVSIEL